MNHRQHPVLMVAMSLLVLMLASCLPQARGVASRAFQVWLDAPLDGAQVAVGTAIPIMAHAAFPEGVERMELLANGEPVALLELTIRGDGLVEGRTRWQPMRAGVYHLRVRVTVGDRVFLSPGARVIVGEGTLTTATSTPGLMPTETPLPTSAHTPVPTPTPTSTHTPTPRPTPMFTPTPTPIPTPTSTPTPAPYINFWADATTVPAGTCTVIHWETAYVQAVYLDGYGVVGVGSRETCPCMTETHTLEVMLPDGSRDVRQLTINVTGTCATPTPVPDTTAPPVPQPIGPGTVDEKNPERIWKCPVTLQWNPVSDPSGVVYYVVLDMWDYSTNQWQLTGLWYPVSGTQVTTNRREQCEYYTTYRWRVKAEDGAGNSSNFSPWLYYMNPVP